MGAKNCELEEGHTDAGPEMEQVGLGATVRTTSEVSVQPLDWMTVKRNVALEEDTWAVVFKELAESIVAVPPTTLQVVEAIGSIPWVAWPCKLKVVEAPCVQLVWLGPA